VATNGLGFVPLIQMAVCPVWNALNVVCSRGFIFIPYCQVKGMKFIPVTVAESFSQLQNAGHGALGVGYYTMIFKQKGGNHE
jgi:hypothetical protein